MYGPTYWKYVTPLVYSKSCCSVWSKRVHLIFLMILSQNLIQEFVVYFLRRPYTSIKQCRASRFPRLLPAFGTALVQSFAVLAIASISKIGSGKNTVSDSNKTARLLDIIPRFLLPPVKGFLLHALQNFFRSAQPRDISFSVLADGSNGTCRSRWLGYGWEDNAIPSWRCLFCLSVQHFRRQYPTRILLFGNFESH